MHIRGTEAANLQRCCVLLICSLLHKVQNTSADWRYPCGSACAALCGLVMWSFLQLLLGSYLGPASRTIFALLGAIVFSAYIVLDTENLIAKHDLDDYVAASLSLYLVSSQRLHPLEPAGGLRLGDTYVLHIKPCSVPAL